MKKILITGANSYIGTSFENYMKNFEGYQIDTLDMLGGSWTEYDFSGYDVIFHVAGIAHSDVKKPTKEIIDKYYMVNTALTHAVATKAKESGVSQFVFMSSMIVFGNKSRYIDENTIPRPDNFYGDSKLQADIAIQALQDNHFNVVSLRPPMIYGKGSKGNYPKLAMMAKKVPIFPDFNNKRSMLYIENLCEFVRLIIDNNEAGYFYPQNEEYVKTTDLVKAVAEIAENKITTTKILNFFISIARRHKLVNKVFGDRYYDKYLSDYKNFSYCVCDFEESIRRTEGK